MFHRTSLLKIVVAALAVSLADAAPGWCLEPKVVTFAAGDGVEIVADYYAPTGPAAAPVVILLHMYRSDRAAWKPLVPPLHEAGFAVLAIDMRGHGDSIKPENLNLRRRMRDRDSKLFNAMHRDVFAAYGFLSQQPNCDLSRFALVGASVGCSVALDVARRDRSVDVVVCMSPGEAYMDVDSRTHMKEYAKYGKRPALLLAAPLERRACDVLGRIHPDATVRITKPGTQHGGKVHGTNMFGQVEGIERQVVDFLVDHVGSESKQPVVADVNGGVFWALGSDRAEKIEPKNRRVFSSFAEAEHRGYRAPK